MDKKDMITPFIFGESSILRKELGKTYFGISEKNESELKVSPMESFLEMLNFVIQEGQASNSDKERTELCTIEMDMKRHLETHNWRKRMGYVARTNHEEYDLLELEQDLFGLEGQARSRILEIVIEEFETAVDLSARGASRKLAAIKERASRIERRNRIRALAQNILPPKVDPNEEIRQTNRFHFSIITAILISSSNLSAEEIIEKTDQWIEQFSHPNSTIGDVDVVRRELYEAFELEENAFTKEFDGIWSLWKPKWDEQMSKDDLIASLYQIKSILSESSSNSDEAPDTSIPKVKFTTPVKKVHASQVIGCIAQFIDDVNDKIQFNNWLNKGTPPTKPIIFNGNANQLVSAFKTLFDQGYLNARYRKVVQKWMVDHFQFLNDGKPTPLLDDYVKKLLSKNCKPPFHPILEVVNRQVMSPDRSELKKTAKRR